MNYSSNWFCIKNIFKSDFENQNNIIKALLSIKGTGFQ